MNLFQPFTLKKLKIKNRIAVPAMLIDLGNTKKGMVSDEKVAHYKRMAEGGAGLIIQESVAISSIDGKAIDYELDFYDDSAIDEMKKIVEAVHKEDCPIILQLCHAGVTAVDPTPICPSSYTCTKAGRTRTGREMSIEDIKRVQNEFVNATKRAVLAGYDGIEIHGCHRYLISQFLNTRVNKRSDAYGKKPELFVIEILKEIKKCVPDEFIVGIRIGGFEPTLDASMRYSKELEKAGIDFLDVSYGCTGEFDSLLTKDYPWKDIIYAASEIKKIVDIPVFAVNGITTGEQAQAILDETKVDMVDIGRNILIDPSWPSHTKNQEISGKCIDCRQCFWHTKPDKCPGRTRFYKAQVKGD